MLKFPLIVIALSSLFLSYWVYKVVRRKEYKYSLLISIIAFVLCFFIVTSILLLIVINTTPH
ncbi:MAG: hypothetical protein QM802_00825 [Agriterribacter sp.]